MWMPKFALLACILAFPAFGDTMCSSSNLVAIVNTSCDISGSTNGSPFALAFTFHNLIAESDTGISPWSAADFNFTPVNGGFTLSFLGGPLSLTSSPGVEIGEYVELPFDIAFCQGRSESFPPRRRKRGPLLFLLRRFPYDFGGGWAEPCDPLAGRV